MSDQEQDQKATSEQINVRLGLLDAWNARAVLDALRSALLGASVARRALSTRSLQLLRPSTHLRERTLLLRAALRSGARRDRLLCRIGRLICLARG